MPTAGKRSSTEVTIALDDAPGAGGVARTVTSYIMEIAGLKVTSNMQGSTAYGDTIEKMLPTGTSKLEKVRLKGLMDTTATTGPHAVMKAPDTDPNAGTRTLTVVVGDSKTWQTECYLESYEATPKANNLTEFECVLVQVSGGWQ